MSRKLNDESCTSAHRDKSQPNSQRDEAPNALDIWRAFCLAKCDQGTCGSSARGIMPSALLPNSTTRHRLVTKTMFSRIPNRTIFRRVCRLLDHDLATGVLPANIVDHIVRGIDVAGR
jgi:hypothetical protein